jgi:hypothetical protein
MRRLKYVEALPNMPFTQSLPRRSRAFTVVHEKVDQVQFLQTTEFFHSRRRLSLPSFLRPALGVRFRFFRGKLRE